jgi:hypothetical protein
MSKDTIESEYLGDMYAKHAGQLGWSAFASGEQPDELVILFEEGEQEIDGNRGAILNAILELALADFARMPLVERVGARMIAVASALGHPGCHAMPLPGAAARLAGADPGTIRGILMYLLHGANTLNAESVGKHVLSVAIFLNRDELTGWSMSAVGRGAHETPAGMMERIRRMCSRPIERSGGKGKATWQQPEGQRQASAEAQKKSHATRKRAKKTPKP